ncbi:MAG: hypothetical protein WEE50_00875 [Chloroflexota bacterium]
MRVRARRALVALVWLLLVVAIAMGAAGLVSGAHHQPGTSARPELTYTRDGEVDVALDAATRDLETLVDQVAALGVQARGALAALNGTDSSTVDAAIAEGSRLLDGMLAQTSAVRRALLNVPYVARTDVGLLVSAARIERHAALVAALDATDGLQEAWVRLTSGSVTATRLSGLLARHDDEVTDAAALGRAARYEDAIERLDDADATVDEARTLRNQLANTVDVTVLDAWLDRLANYDVALRDLYVAYSNVGPRVTDELREAQAAEAAARRELPSDTRGMVVIMAEIGRGGMNGAVVAIEQARGRLTSAIEAANS